MFTNLSGTTMIFTTCLPAMNGCTLGSASASFSISACGVPKGTDKRPRTLPLTCSTTSAASSFASASIECRPRLAEHGARAAQLLPQLLGQIGSERPDQQHQRRQDLIQRRARQICVFVIQRVEQFHQRRDRRIEVPAIVEVFGDLLNGLVQFAQRPSCRPPASPAASRSKFRVTKR